MGKTNRGLPIVAFMLGLAGFSGTVCAAASDQEAALLGKDLTPVGAERAGNKDGSIPKWDGGLPKGKHKLGDPRVDPFVADKPLFSIDASNVDKYKDKLSAGQKVMASFRLYPLRCRRRRLWPRYATTAIARR